MQNPRATKAQASARGQPELTQEQRLAPAKEHQRREAGLEHQVHRREHLDPQRPQGLHSEHRREGLEHQGLGGLDQQVHRREHLDPQRPQGLHSEHRPEGLRILQAESRSRCFSGLLQRTATYLPGFTTSAISGSPGLFLREGSPFLFSLPVSRSLCLSFA